MPEANNWNDTIITEFRANGGRVGGNFEGASVTLVHHRGRKSGRESVNPLMYLPDDADKDAIYVFATKGGAPSNPDWYYNLTAAGQGTVERGTGTYPVTVGELLGDERDRVPDGARAGVRGPVALCWPVGSGSATTLGVGRSWADRGRVRELSDGRQHQGYSLGWERACVCHHRLWRATNTASRRDR